jgi:membrane-bound metal-dependent hydrolase YbcI (DUF457 family)
MANGTTHRLVAAVVIGSACAHAERDEHEKTTKPLAGAGIAALLTNLPDVIEPAAHPNHRQFFHSCVFAGVVAWAAYRAYKWEPATPTEDAIRFIALIGAGAYLVHLVLDAGTAKSLPLIGRL